MPNHDACYKTLFSTPELVRDLLRDFVSGDWMRTLDFDTLERRSGTYVTDAFRQHASDMVWRIQAGGEWVYLYLLIEFQSTVDRQMAIRMTNYVTCLDLELIRGQNMLDGGRLPPVLPVVIYNGEGRWTATTDIADLSPRLPGELSGYQPRCKYLLVDASRYSDEELARLDNLVAAVFRFENATSEETLLDTVRWLRRRVADNPVLSNTFVRWLKDVGSRHRHAGLDFTNVHNLMEAEMSLSTNIARWKANYRLEGLQEGRLEGLQEGRQEGLQQGQAMMLRSMLAKRFGPLPAELETRLNGASAEQLQAWGERLLSAQHLADVFEA